MNYFVLSITYNDYGWFEQFLNISDKVSPVLCTQIFSKLCPAYSGLAAATADVKMKEMDKRLDWDGF